MFAGSTCQVLARLRFQSLTDLRNSAKYQLSSILCDSHQFLLAFCTTQTFLFVDFCPLLNGPPYLMWTIFPPKKFSIIYGILVPIFSKTKMIFVLNFSPEVLESEHLVFLKRTLCLLSIRCFKLELLVDFGAIAKSSWLGIIFRKWTYVITHHIFDLYFYLL